MNIIGLVIGYFFELIGFQGKQVGFLVFFVYYGFCVEIFKIYSYLVCVCGIKLDQWMMIREFFGMYLFAIIVIVKRCQVVFFNFFFSFNVVF